MSKVTFQGDLSNLMYVGGGDNGSWSLPWLFRGWKSKDQFGLVGGLFAILRFEAGCEDYVWCVFYGSPNTLTWYKPVEVVECPCPI